MRITENHTYAHSTDTVFFLFTDAKEIEATQKAVGARNIRILDCKRESEGAIVRFVRELPAEVPGLLSRFLKPWNSVEQAQRWRSGDGGRYKADLAIDVANVPITVSGTLELKPVDDGCVNQIRLDVDCSIPLLGKSLAEFAATDCKRIMAAEYKHNTDRLGRD
jgi:hypothetical protein